MTKLAEGGFNKVFRLVMDDDTIVIARIPNPNAGPPFKTTASEVATVNSISWLIHYSSELSKLIEPYRWARTVLKILVLKFLSSSGEAVNPVESEYI